MTTAYSVEYDDAVHYYGSLVIATSRAREATVPEKTTAIIRKHETLHKGKPILFEALNHTGWADLRNAEFVHKIVAGRVIKE